MNSGNAEQGKDWKGREVKRKIQINRIKKNYRLRPIQDKYRDRQIQEIGERDTEAKREARKEREEARR